MDFDSYYYDRKGQPMSQEDWLSKFDDLAYKRVAQDTLLDGRWVSTVWVGMNHQMGAGPPLIFETMVFPSNDNMNDEYCERYSTEEQAVVGHAEVLERLSKEMA